MFCFYDRETPILRLSHCRIVHFSTHYPVETWSGPLGNILSWLRACAYQHTGSAFIICSGFKLDHNILSGGPGRNRTAVQNTFRSTSYDHTKSIYYIKYFYFLISHYSANCVHNSRNTTNITQLLYRPTFLFKCIIMCLNTEIYFLFLQLSPCQRLNIPELTVLLQCGQVFLIWLGCVPFASCFFTAFPPKKL
jgi:hypothetical protein